MRLCEEKKGVESRADSLPRRCCRCAVESFPSTLTQIMCYTLQADLMEDSYSILRPDKSAPPAKPHELVTRHEPNVGTEPGRGGAKGGCVFSFLLKIITNHRRVAAAMETYRVTCSIPRVRLDDKREITPPGTGLELQSAGGNSARDQG